MDYAIYIPTYHRTDKQVTIDYIPDDLKDRTFFVAPPEDEAPLARYGVRVLTGAPPHIHNVRQWVLDNHDSDSYGPGILFLDDDLIFARRREDVPSRFHRVEGPGEMDELFNLISFTLEHSPVVGIASRLFANNCTTPFRVNHRMYNAWGCNVETAREEGWRIDRVPVMEDFDFQLQALLAGYSTVAVNTFTQDNSAGANAPGGVSEHGGREDNHKVAARFLVETYPGIVKAVIRDTWENMPNRVDVQIQWKKAAQRGREYRELMGLEPTPVLDPTDPLLGIL